MECHAKITTASSHSTKNQVMPNWLVKLTPTGAACWYPPLRSGAPYLGR
jgi:hypothetical protein